MLDYRIKKFTSFLWISVGEQLHRTFHVGEQHRDLLAFAFERIFRGENFFGEMLRRVSFRRGKLDSCHCRRQRRPALVAEFIPGGICCSASSATGLRTRATLPAELHPDRIVMLATRTLHAISSILIVLRLEFSLGLETYCLPVAARVAGGEVAVVELPDHLAAAELVVVVHRHDAVPSALQLLERVCGHAVLYAHLHALHDAETRAVTSRLRALAV